MKVLVTGGCGYIGSHTVCELLKNNYEVVIIDNFSNSKKDVMTKIETLTGKSAKLYVGDVCDKSLLEEIFSKEKIEAAIHFAGYKAVGESVQKPLMYYENNLISTLYLLEIMNKYDPENMKRLSKDAGDEEYLAFAETLNDTDMQLAIISYVEILINLEICEVSYEQKKEILQKNRIKRELYEEYIELQERKALFIKKLKEKDFPVDAERLIGNYFRVAQKDPDGSFNALVKNPAMFSPIEFEKIRPKFFGLIKVTPEDGIKANQKIGHFIKKLKV